MANNTKFNHNSNSSEEFVEEDQLSSLPDEILIKILSLLPISVAAETAVLSHRWRYLWKSITNFQFQTLDMEFQAVNNILQQLISPKIHVFDYSYSVDEYENVRNNDNDYYLMHFKLDFEALDFEAAESCYLRILRRNVEVLKVRSGSFFPSHKYLPVPNCVFNCESLIVLELDGPLKLKLKLDEQNDLPVDGTKFYLPNLKKLHLRIDDIDYCLVRTLLKFCPKLEDLSLVLDPAGADILEIFAPNLKSLNIDNLVVTPYSDVVIDAPKLAKLKICDMCSYYSFVTIPASLVEASFNFISYEDPEWDIFDADHHDWTIEGHACAISKFFRGMSSVRSLKLLCFANMHMFLCSADDGDMSIFHDLTFFQAMLDCLVGWEDLLCTLHCFPNLKHLELRMDKYYFRGPSSWFAPIILPDCLLSKVKKITLHITATIHAFKLIELILNNANVLEELFIYALTGPSHPLMEFEVGQHWTEHKFCEALFNLSRSFLTCEIVFSGAYINASSNDFEKGLIGCQIRSKDSD